jgi:hypothetical protein
MWNVLQIHFRGQLLEEVEQSLRPFIHRLCQLIEICVVLSMAIPIKD